jgi:hypothetical protein
MLRFKQFLVEGVVDQIQASRTRADLLGKNLAKTGKSTNYALGGIGTYVFVEPKDSRTLGDYRFLSKEKEYSGGVKLSHDAHKINIYTDSPAQIRIPTSQENSALRHELQHLFQKSRQLQDNPHYALNRKKSNKYNQLRMTSSIEALMPDNIKNDIKKEFSYRLDPQEVNARGIERAGDAIEHHNELARSKITSDPRFADYEFELEKSLGRAKAPELDPNIGRSQAELAFQTHMGKENEGLDFLSDVLQDVKKGDATRAAKDIKTAKKSIASDVARGLQSNVDYAQQVAQDAYSDKVIKPQRERQTRVAQMKNDFDATRPMGFNSGVFMSDPISTSNFAYDVAGAMGDVTTRDQTMKKAASSLYNPMYSDSEQMMGDAFLRGGGEGYAVDPTFLQVANQRAKNREEEKKRKAGPLSGPLQTIQRPD